jgi:hypothetical protein
VRRRGLYTERAVLRRYLLTRYCVGCTPTNTITDYDKLASGGNGDGRIDSNDPVFSSLLLWQDSNHDGLSEPEELHTLHSLGLAAIDLDYKESRRIDQYGNRFKYRAKVFDVQGAQVGDGHGMSSWCLHL